MVSFFDGRVRLLRRDRVYVVALCVFFFFKQKTAYEMRISDWSSDVCSSDLHSDETSYAFFYCAGASAAGGGCGAGRFGAREEVLEEIGRASCRGRVCPYV